MRHTSVSTSQPFEMAVRTATWLGRDMTPGQPVSVELNPAGSHALVRFAPPLEGVPSELTSDDIDALTVVLDEVVMARLIRGVVERAQLDPHATYRSWTLWLAGPDGEITLDSVGDRLPNGADCDECIARLRLGRVRR